MLVIEPTLNVKYKPFCAKMPSPGTRICVEFATVWLVMSIVNKIAPEALPSRISNVHAVLIVGVTIKAFNRVRPA
jgi:hypothetical protein